MGAVGGHGDPGLLADRHVAVHPGIGLELAAREEVRALPGARVRTVGRKAPDPGSVGCPGIPVAEGDDRRAVGRPGRVPEDAVTGDHGGQRAARDLDHVDAGPRGEVRITVAVRRERDPRAVR
jgi:hypothetical protein